MGANLQEVRERIKSVKSTQQITKAMKMVSAAKLRRAQQAIVQLRPYADRLNKMLMNILTNLDGDVNSSFGKERDLNKGLLVVVTSDRGLCGAFNSNILKAAVNEINTTFADVRSNGNLSIMCIGKRGYDFMRKRYTDCNIISDHVGQFMDLSFDKVAEIASEIMTGFEDNEYDLIKVCYGRFKNAAMQFPEAVQFLPVEKIEPAKSSKNTKADYIFEPDKEGLLEHLIPSILQTSFHKYLLDTNASEHGARMTAMDKATENAEDLLNDLKIGYNKARQEVITNQLSEIVGGAAALGG